MAVLKCSIYFRIGKFIMQMVLVHLLTAEKKSSTLDRLKCRLQRDGDFLLECVFGKNNAPLK